MRKKLLTMLLALVAALCLCFGLAACGETSETTTVEPHTHTYTDYVFNNDATCTKDGTESAHCTYPGCAGLHTRTAEGSKLGHNLEFQAGTATCLQAGTLDYWKCLRCEKSFADSEGTIAMTVFTSDVPLGHRFTVENVCDRCGTKWEYTEGLTYVLDETTDTYEVGRNADASGDVVIPYGYNGKFVTSIGYHAFYNCSGLESIIIPDGVTSIGNGAFSGCSGLTSVTIGSGVTAIGESTFENCSELASITIPDSVTEIGESAFSGCSELASITIPDSVTEIGSSAFYGTAYYNDATKWDSSGVLYIGNHLIKAKKDVLSGAYTIRTGTKTIAPSAFSYCTGLTSITIPNGVTSIGNDAFYKCSGLTRIVIPDSVTQLGGAFQDCTELTNVQIGSGVTKISAGTFLGCSRLISVTMGDNVTEIGDYAFEKCGELANIVIPNSVTYIGRGAFSETAFYKDKSKWDSSGVLYIGDHLIDAETTLTGAYTIKLGTKTIAPSAFSNCTGLTGITIPNSVISIGDHAFYNCSELESVTIPDSVTKIGSNVFYNCGKLKNVTIGRGVVILYGVFANCIGLESITIPDSVIYIEYGAFAGCTGLTSITIPDSVTEIGYGAFYSCEKLTSIVIPNTVTEIGSWAFRDCTALTDIQFKGTVAEWQAIEKASDWDKDAGDYTVTCTDGTVDKEGNVTYFKN